MKTLGKVFLNVVAGLSVVVMFISILTMLKIVTPLVVVSGSMEPVIHTGSLILSVKTDAASLNVGDIATFPREDGVLVTHRVVSNDAVVSEISGLRSIVMKGDANDTKDQTPYVNSEGLKPLITIPNAGSVMAFVMDSKMAIIAIASFGFGFYFLFKMIANGRREKNNSDSDIEKAQRELENA
jgi:signal peptidase